jgi:hypothetical protein
MASALVARFQLLLGEAKEELLAQVTRVKVVAAVVVVATTAAVAHKGVPLPTQAVLVVVAARHTCVPAQYL